MSASITNAAVLWTGWKDSMLALHEAQQNNCRVSCLLTFAPPAPTFRAHPIAFMKLQAEALGLPHFLWPVHEPFTESYEAGLRWLKEMMAVDTVVTGDIAEVNGSPNWIHERSRPVGMNVMTPLWGRNRLVLLQELLAAGLKVIFSCVKTRWLTADWVGRELDRQAISDLGKLRERNGLDLCGEQGEYHTLVTDAPDFNGRLQLDSFQIGEDEGMAYLQFERAELKAKP